MLVSFNQLKISGILVKRHVSSPLDIYKRMSKTMSSYSDDSLRGIFFLLELETIGALAVRLFPLFKNHQECVSIEPEPRRERGTNNYGWNLLVIGADA